MRLVRTARLFNDLHQLRAFTKVTIPSAAILKGGKADFVLGGKAEKFGDALKTLGNVFFFHSKTFAISDHTDGRAWTTMVIKLDFQECAYTIKSLYKSVI